MEKITEQEMHILEVAEQLFLERGFLGTSTTDIAQAADCNQALIHYYYRTKEKLFRKIFETKVSLVLDYLEAYTFPNDIMTALGDLIGFYFSLLRSNPRLPFFFINELVLNEERREWLRETFVNDPRRKQVYAQYEQHVHDAIAAGKIRQIEPFQLLLDAVSLTVMSFLTLPIYQDLLQKTPAETDVYLTARQAEVLETLRRRLSV
jgi:AcrR family transcriptional regulator